jgi:ELWxxDGT repeat protein
MIKDIFPGSSGSYPGLTVVNGTVFLTATDGTTGTELWKTDGTAAGTVRVKDVNPTGSGNLQGLTAVGGTLYFRADEGSLNSTLWQSDGTAAGTTQVLNRSVSGLTAHNGTLVFSADDREHGWEPWHLVPGGPAITVTDTTVTEGNVGTTAATFTVRLSEAHDQPVTVAYATAAGTATAGTDYQSVSGSLTFAPGETVKTITVLVNGDQFGEPNETFVVNLSSATNATIADAQGTGTILDDEPRISIGDATVTEGNTGTRAITFTVTLSAAYDQPVSVAYATGNGTATAASDYQAVNSGTLTFSPGQTTKTITILVYGDRVPEPNETFFVNLSPPASAVVTDGQGMGTIVDDEPRISISDVSKAEGKKGKTTLFVFTVTLSTAYDQPVTMSFRTVNGTATTNNKDYVAKSGTLTFSPGETTKTITIEVTGDNRREPTEYFYLDLFGNSSNSLFAKSRGIGWILNDD